MELIEKVKQLEIRLRAAEEAGIILYTHIRVCKFIYEG